MVENQSSYSAWTAMVAPRSRLVENRIFPASDASIPGGPRTGPLWATEEGIFASGCRPVFMCCSLE
jgi:hypothetical protein